MSEQNGMAQMLAKYPIDLLLPSHRNLPIHVGQETHSHPTEQDKDMIEKSTGWRKDRFLIRIIHFREIN